ncbi:unnamed protein product (macronuclear) [Paramecium tetraurelia]|uniref:Transmembrane protein n=2 Tax=Paramecium tetraurelia TaxID=5888 RepID=A0DMM4_PARTE|nr:uncharacterized protein GSPATT00039673001 [Paramecium tetraurelia]CAK84291.1 unnamed protein product [Paramecium tetraurelia]|eukprot:XP_001451688.1 hypothetical protein (macronuclear) [Paramecium tetraurelia strain d4-2]
MKRFLQQLQNQQQVSLKSILYQLQMNILLSNFMCNNISLSTIRKQVELFLLKNRIQADKIKLKIFNKQYQFNILLFQGQTQ